MRHLPEEHPGFQIARCIAGSDSRLQIKRLFYTREDALGNLDKGFETLTFFGGDGLMFSAAGLVSDFLDPPTIYLEDDFEIYHSRPEIILRIDISEGPSPNEYLRVRLMVEDMSVLKEFATGDAAADWQSAVDFMRKNPGNYRKSKSDFSDFAYLVPFYKVVEDEEGTEMIVHFPEDDLQNYQHDDDLGPDLI